MQIEQTDQAINFSRAKIMIVDDDPELRMALKMRLRANQYETVSACDGYSAIALAQKERPNLIILDLGLPAGNGYSVLKRLQENDALSSIPSSFSPPAILSATKNVASMPAPPRSSRNPWTTTNCSKSYG